MKSNYTRLDQTKHKKVTHIASDGVNKAERANSLTIHIYLHAIHKYMAKGLGKQFDPGYDRTEIKTIGLKAQIL